jgi:Domain of unknown function (DUF892)
MRLSGYTDRSFSRARKRGAQHVQETLMAKKEKMLKDLFPETLKDIYYAEKKILTALPKIAKAVQSEDLQACLRETRGRDQGSGRAARAGFRAHQTV